MDPPREGLPARSGSGTLKLDAELRRAIVDGRPIELSRTEFAVLALLTANPGRLFTREEIVVAVHHDRLACTPRAVDFQVHSIRRKLAAAAARLETVRGAGYRFQA